MSLELCGENGKKDFAKGVFGHFGTWQRPLRILE
jgi:hypothetical protein